MRQILLTALWFPGAVWIVAASSQRLPGSPCAVTVSNAADRSYGNAQLSTLLWPDGVIVFEPGGPGFVTRDLALGTKFPWNRYVVGKLRVTGHRTDGDAAPLRLEAPNGYGDTGFQASYLIFPTPGCWAISAQVGDHDDSKIEFVTRVVKIGDGPSWRRGDDR